MQEIIQFSANHMILAVGWIFLLVLVIISIISSIFSKVKIINLMEAVRLINKEEAVVIDIRNRNYYRKGHIATAINVLGSDIKKGNFSALEKFKTTPIIVVCENGVSAYQASNQLIKYGFKHVYVLKHGLSGWNGENLPLVVSSK